MRKIDKEAIELSRLKNIIESSGVKENITRQTKLDIFYFKVADDYQVIRDPQKIFESTYVFKVNLCFFCFCFTVNQGF